MIGLSPVMRQCIIRPRLIRRADVEDGPEPAFTAPVDAAAQLRQTGPSFIAQHWTAPEVRCADEGGFRGIGSNGRFGTSGPSAP